MKRANILCCLFFLLIPGCFEDPDRSPIESDVEIEGSGVEQDCASRCIKVRFCFFACPRSGCCEDRVMLDTCHPFGPGQCSCRNSAGFVQGFECGELADCPWTPDPDQGTVSPSEGYQQTPGGCLP